MGLAICLTDQESCQMGLWGTEKGRGSGKETEAERRCGGLSKAKHNWHQSEIYNPRVLNPTSSVSARTGFGAFAVKPHYCNTLSAWGLTSIVLRALRTASEWPLQGEDLGAAGVGQGRDRVTITGEWRSCWAIASVLSKAFRKDAMHLNTLQWSLCLILLIIYIPALPSANWPSAMYKCIKLAFAFSILITATSPMVSRLRIFVICKSAHLRFCSISLTIARSWTWLQLKSSLSVHSSYKTYMCKYS